MSFPRQLSEITPDWLNTVLVDTVATTTGRVIRFEAEPVARQGLTSLAHVLSLSYEGESAGAPERLLAKFSLDVAPVQEALAANRGFQREVDFYKTVGVDPGIPTPRCYFADYHQEDNACLLLLEFVDGAREADRLYGRSEDVELIVGPLARFHARWWGREAEFGKVCRGQAPFIVDLFVGRLTPALESIRRNFGSEVGRTLISLLELWLPHAHRIASYLESKPQTLCHGDLHLDQILFLESEGDPFRLIDWQFFGIDSGPVDLAHLLLSGLLPEQRQQREHELVERYHDGLLEGGVLGHSIDDTWECYRLGLVRLALFYLTAFSTGDIEPALAWWAADEKRKGVSFWDVACRWPSQALEEHGALELLARIVGGTAPS